MRRWFILTNFVVIVLLTACNICLIVSLKRKESIMAERLGKDSSVYSSEKIKIVTIAILFILSYVFDMVYEQVFLDKEFTTPEAREIIQAEIYYIFDPIPIFTVLVVHWKNFRIVPYRGAQATSSCDDKTTMNNESQSMAVCSRLYDETKSIISQEDLLKRRLIFKIYRDNNMRFSGSILLDFESTAMRDLQNELEMSQGGDSEFHNTG